MFLLSVSKWIEAIPVVVGNDNLCSKMDYAVDIHSIRLVVHADSPPCEVFSTDGLWEYRSRELLTYTKQTPLPAHTKILIQQYLILLHSKLPKTHIDIFL